MGNHTAFLVQNNVSLYTNGMQKLERIFGRLKKPDVKDTARNSGLSPHKEIERLWKESDDATQANKLELPGNLQSLWLNFLLWISGDKNS